MAASTALEPSLEHLASRYEDDDEEHAPPAAGSQAPAQGQSAEPGGSDSSYEVIDDDVEDEEDLSDYDWDDYDGERLGRLPLGALPRAVAASSASRQPPHVYTFMHHTVLVSAARVSAAGSVPLYARMRLYRQGKVAVHLGSEVGPKNKLSESFKNWVKIGIRGADTGHWACTLAPCFVQRPWPVAAPPAVGCALQGPTPTAAPRRCSRARSRSRCVRVCCEGPAHRREGGNGGASCCTQPP